jgi:hypothetical protein
MDFPPEIRRIIGYYAVSSLTDAQVLHRGRIVEMHSRSLSCLDMKFTGVDQAIRAMGALLFSGMRKLTLDRTTSDACLQRLVNHAPGLEELDLGQCRGLVHTHHVSRFPKLHTLAMVNCPSVTGICSATLRKLTLVDCGLTADDIGTLTSLELKGCAVASGTPLSSTLEHLTLRGNCFGPERADWSDAMDPERWMNLKTLNLTMIRSFDNARVATISSMKNLESLTLNGCPYVTDFSFLAGLNALRTLRVEANFDWTMLKHVQLYILAARGFYTQDLQHLKTQTDLRSLRLAQSATPRLDPACVLSRLIPGWANLHTLDLFYCTALMATHRFPICPSVTCLKIDFCKFITDDKLAQLMISFPNVDTFSGDFTRISDAGIAHLHRRTRILNLRGCDITDAALPYISRMRCLTSLDIAYTHIEHIEHLSKQPKSLTALDVSGCSQTCVEGASRLSHTTSRIRVYNTFSIY